jgi:hypothetical protein
MESAVNVNELLARRMNKKQQMRWNRATAQPFLDVRTAVLNDTLEDAFRRRYPRFRPTNRDEVVASHPQRNELHRIACMLPKYPANRGGRPCGDRGFDHADARSARLNATFPTFLFQVPMPIMPRVDVRRAHGVAPLVCAGIPANARAKAPLRTFQSANRLGSQVCVGRAKASSGL